MIQYDEIVARSYETDREGEEHWQLESDFLKTHLARYQSGRILDIPVGTGRFFGLYKLLGIAEVVGIDISPHMLAEATKNVPKQLPVKLYMGDAFTIDCPDNAFEAVICFRLLHLIPGHQRLALLQELLRVGREVVLQVYLSRRLTLLELLWRRFRLMAQTKVIKPWSSIASYSLQPDELNGILGAAGAKIIFSEKLCNYEGEEVRVYVLEK